MTTRYPPTQQPPARLAKCGGCSGAGGCPGTKACDEDCCTFPCLSRPQFYCGMVLTDDHLNDLERWTRQRLSLHRYVEGWGVAAGLSLRKHPDQPGSVIVGTGYARSCCGDDVVVCQELTIDVCTCGTSGSCCGAGHSGSTAPGDGSSATGAVDVYLVPSHIAVDPVAVGGCSCGGHDELVHERIIDGGTLRCVPVADDSVDPVTQRANVWATGFRDCTDVLIEYVRNFQDGADVDNVRKWLIGWIDRHGDPSLALIRSWLSDDQVNDSELAAKALIEIVSACRRSYLERTFAACACADGQPGILLGRVWTDADGPGCRVRCIDADAPYRQVLSGPGWPEMPGSVNLAPLVWRRWTVVQPRRPTLGITLTPQPLPLPAPSELPRLMRDADIYVQYQSSMIALLYRDHCYRPQTVGDPDHDGRLVAWSYGPYDVALASASTQGEAVAAAQSPTVPSVPAKSVPAKSVPAKSASAPSAPAKSAPSAPAKSAPSAPAKSAKSVPPGPSKAPPSGAGTVSAVKSQARRAVEVAVPVPPVRARGGRATRNTASTRAPKS